MKKVDHPTLKLPVLSIYVLVFFSIWTVWELWGKSFIDNTIENEYLCQCIKSGVIKNAVWTLPAVLLVHHFSSDVSIPLKAMFSTKINWLKYLPIFIGFTIYILSGAILLNGKLEIVSGFGLNDIIVVLFVGLTEEIVFRGWLLNATICEDKKWFSILINAVMFLAIHFPKWIHDGTFISRFIGLDFLGILVLSSIFSVTFIKSRNILMSMALHMYWDLLIFMFLE